MRAKQWVYHEEYDQFELFKNDIGIIQLPVNVPYDENTMAAYVYPFDPTITEIFETKFQGKTAMVAGWGRLGGKEDSILPDDLQFTKISVVSRAYCVKNPIQICTRTASTERVQVIKIRIPTVYIDNM